MLVLPLLARAQNLGGAADFGVLGGSTVTNTGLTTINGSVGVSPGTAITGFPPGVATGGIHANDAQAMQAHLDALATYTQLAAETFQPVNNLTGQNLGGLTLVPGTYHFDTAAQLTGTLTLNSGGNANAQFHFQIGTALTTALGSMITWLNGVSGNVFWQVGSSATLGGNSLFYGNILADQSITLNTGAALNGRALAINGAVTLDTNAVAPVATAPATGRIWNGGASNLWSGVNWSPDLTGTSSSTLAPAADVVFSVTGVTPQNQNTVLDVSTTVSSLTVNDPAAVTISGPGTLSILGSGATTGITINRGAGATTINSNLVLGGSSQTVAVHNAAGLIINGVVGGAVGLAKTGSGQLTLAGMNTYAGTTALLQGTLEIDGAIAGSALAAGGTLRGVGTVGGNLSNAAAVSPGRGEAPGTLNINGSFGQARTGSLNIRLASPTGYDRLAIGGRAMLGGTLNVSSLNGFAAEAGETFTILRAAGGVSGAFADFHDAQATGTLLRLEVVYQRQAVLLEFAQGSFASLGPEFGLSPNEVAVARALDRLAAAQPDSKLIRRLDALPLSQLPGALSLLSPEDFSAIFTAGLAIPEVQVSNLERRLEEVRRGANGFSDSGFGVSDSHGGRNFEGKSTVNLDGKGTAALDGKSSQAAEQSPPPDRRLGFYLSGTGEMVDLDSTGSARGSSFTTGGVTVGADYRFTSHLVLGVAIGYANTSAELSRGGDLNLNSGQVSLYGTYYTGGWYLDALIGGGYSSIDTKRRTLGGFARGDADATDLNGLLGTGYDFHVGSFTVGPVASIRYGTFGIDSFNERGALGSERIGSRSQNSLESAVGLRATWTKGIGRIVWTPEIRAQWQHEYLPNDSSIDAGFSSDEMFTVHGPGIGRDGLLLEAGAAAQLNADLAIFAYYSGEFARENYSVHSLTGGLRVSF